MTAPNREQGSLMPVPKVAAGAAAGAATVLLVWIAGMLGADVPPEVASAVTVLLSAGAAYVRR